MGTLSDAMARENLIREFVEQVKKELEANAGNKAACDALKRLGMFALMRIEFVPPKWTDEYDRLFAEAIPVLKTPEEWCRDSGVLALDPDGWRNAEIPWDEPISHERFEQLLVECTIMHRRSND